MIRLMRRHNDVAVLRKVSIVLLALSFAGCASFSQTLDEKLNVERLSPSHIAQVKALIAKLEPFVKKKDQKGELPTLTFKKLPAPLHIPFNALTAFFDPGVQFGLQFRSEGEAGKTGPMMVPPSEPVGEPTPQPEPAAEKPAPAPGEVVSLDSFRKK